MPPAREREVKLDLAPGVTLPSFVGVAGVAEVVQVPPVHLDAQYWDTAALDLLGVGATLRRRTGESAVSRWTLKIPAGPTPAGGLLDRLEHDVDDDRTEPPAGLLAEAGAITTTPLAPVARLVSDRRRLVLRDDGGRELARIDDDHVVAHVDDRPDQAFREVEIELETGDDGILEALVARLADAGARPADPRPKLARALEHRLGGEAG